MTSSAEFPEPPAAPPRESDDSDGGLDSDKVFLGMLVVSFPLAIASHFFFPGTPTFILAAIALVPLARLMGEATEVLAHRVGSGVGGLLNATFGNAAELILALAALRKGQLAVVKASITGAVLGNICLVLGAAILAGGIRREKQTFNATAVLSGSSMMFLAIVAMTVPDLFHVSLGVHALPFLGPLSVGISVVLLVIYGLSLYFSLRTHRHIYMAEQPAPGTETKEEMVHWSVRRAVFMLLLATAGVVVAAEFLVEAIEPAIESFGFTHTFVGVVVIAIVGNAAEHSTAILVALKDKMDLAFNIAFESSKQIAMFVAPILVLSSLAMGETLTLEFSHMEVAGMGMSVFAATLIALDGETNWLEGVMLLGVYAIFAVTFFYIP